MAFGVLSLVAWWLTAPPPAEGVRPLSLDTVAEIWRNRNPNAPGSRATATSTGTLASAAGLREIRLANVAAVDITGTDRQDITWTLTSEASGRNEAQARAAAEQTVLRHDDMGTVLALAVQGAGGSARGGTLTLAVPRRLGVRIESARRTRVSEVSAVRLENLVGDVALQAISGPVEGGHRSGMLTIDDADTVMLSLVGSTTTIRRARGAIDLTVRNGTTAVEASTGDVTVEGSGHDLSVVGVRGHVRASLVGGSLIIDRPRGAIDVDARRSRVELAIDQGVPATVFVAEGSLTLALATPPPVALDVAVDSGEIDASAVGLSAAVQNGRQRLVDDRSGVARMAVRVERGSIVIVPLK